MTIATGSRHSLAYIAEANYGATPATPAFRQLRHKSTTLALTKNTLQSEELRSDRQIADLRHGTIQVGGDIQGELSFGAYDDLFAAALGGSWNANVLNAGTARTSFTLERNFADIGQYLRYTGCEINGLHFDVQPGAIANVTFDVVGQSEAVDAAPVAGATYVNAPANRPMDALSGAIKEGGQVIGVVTELKLDLANGIEPRFVIGSAKTLQPSIGRSNLTGTLTAYFLDGSLLSKFIGETESSLELTLSDGANSYVLFLPRIKYTGGQADVANDGPITLSLPIQALYDGTAGTHLRITRSGA